jgi:hypothetical protein
MTCSLRCLLTQLMFATAASVLTPFTGATTVAAMVDVDPGMVKAVGFDFGISAPSQFTLVVWSGPTAEFSDNGFNFIMFSPQYPRFSHPRGAVPSRAWSPPRLAPHCGRKHHV